MDSSAFDQIVSTVSWAKNCLIKKFHRAKWRCGVTKGGTGTERSIIWEWRTNGKGGRRVCAFCLWTADGMDVLGLSGSVGSLHSSSKICQVLYRSKYATCT